MDTSDLIRKNQNKPAPEEESVADKLLRECDLIGIGLGGARTAATEAFTREQLPYTALKVGTAVGLGFGMSYLSRLPGAQASIGKIVGTAMTGAFMIDVASNGTQLVLAFQDNWKSNANWNRNSKTMENSLGRFAFDSALMTAGGLGGAALHGRLASPIGAAGRESIPTQPGHRVVERLSITEPPIDLSISKGGWTDLISPTLKTRHTGVAIEMYTPESPIGKILNTERAGIVQVESISMNNPLLVNRGTGFFVNEHGQLATAFHVVSESGGNCTVNIGDRKFAATVQHVEPTMDLALLSISGHPVKTKPLTMAAETLPADGTPTASFGFAQGSNALHVSPGSILSNATILPDSVKLPAAPDKLVLALESHTAPAYSGGPVFNLNTGEVVGLHVTGNGRNLSHARTMREIRTLIDNANGT